MTQRIADRFAACAREGRAALVTYVMAGDPDPLTAQALVDALPAAGADVIELGMPFSDPMADGPSIQAAGLRALKAGMSLKGTLETARRFREKDQATPVVMMGYYNPIYIYGVERFLADAKASGIDGLIVVDLPRRWMASFACLRLPPASPSSASPRPRPTTSACRRC